MIKLLKYTIIAIFSIAILNSCGSNTKGSSNPPATDFAPKTADGFEDMFFNRTIISPSGNKAVILKNKKARHLIFNEVLSGEYVYLYVKINTATIKHTIGNIVCNQTLTFISESSGTLNEICEGRNGTIDAVYQVANGAFRISENQEMVRKL